MAFLDNSGDIILDAVLTDTGRMRMARGDFTIVKFSLGDDEINYRLFNKNHPSGSQYQDIEIMQTPIMEAMTNNRSSMHSKLMSLGRTNILYLPIMRLNNNKAARGSTGIGAATARTYFSADAQKQYYVVTCNMKAESRETTGLEQLSQGIMFGAQPAQNRNKIIVDQGMDTGGFPSTSIPIDSDLRETQFMVKIDHRLGHISSMGSAIDDWNNNTFNARQAYSFIDDDNIATYIFGVSSDPHMIQNIPTANGTEEVTTNYNNKQVFNGPLGSRLAFSIQASDHLTSGTALFDELGSKSLISLRKGLGDTSTTTANFRYIDSLVRVTGVTTGFSIDIPIKFVRWVG